MPRYLVERTFQEGVTLPGSGRESAASAEFAASHARNAVVWVYSFVAASGGKTFCLVDAPSPAAIRQASLCCGLPVDRITAVSVLDPYRFVPEPSSPETEVAGEDQAGEQENDALD